MNATDITTSSIGRVFSLHVPAREEYNNTVVKCVLVIPGTDWNYSDPAVLRVQGMSYMCLLPKLLWDIIHLHTSKQSYTIKCSHIQRLLTSIAMIGLDFRKILAVVGPTALIYSWILTSVLVVCGIWNLAYFLFFLQLSVLGPDSSQTCVRFCRRDFVFHKYLLFISNICEQLAYKQHLST